MFRGCDYQKPDDSLCLLWEYKLHNNLKYIPRHSVITYMHTNALYQEPTLLDDQEPSKVSETIKK